MGKPTIWFPTRSDTNQYVKLQKQARGLKFRIYEEGGSYYPCSANEGAFVFAYADCWFSDAAAQII